MFINKNDYKKALYDTMLNDASTMLVLKRRLDMVELIDGDLFDFGVASPTFLDGMVGIKIRRRSDNFVCVVADLFFFQINDEVLSLKYDLNECVSKYLGLSTKNVTMLSSIMFFDKKKNKNGLGLVITMDFFKFFNNYMTLEMYLSFLISRLFVIDGTLRNFLDVGYPLAVDFFYMLGIFKKDIITKTDFVIWQSDMYNLLISKPVLLNTSLVTERKEISIISSLIDRFNYQLVDKIYDYSLQKCYSYDLCSNCVEAFIPLDTLYRVSSRVVNVITMDCHCVSYLNNFVLCHDRLLGYRQLLSLIKNCKTCKRFEYNLVETQISKLVETMCDKVIKDIGMISDDDKNIIEQVFLFKEDYQEESYCNVFKPKNKSYSKVNNYDDVYDKSEKVYQMVFFSDLKKKFDDNLVDDLNSDSNFLWKTDFVESKLLDDDQYFKIRSLISAFNFDNFGGVYGVVDAVSFILRRLNSIKKSQCYGFQKFIDSTILTHLQYLKYNLVFPSKLLLFSNNNLFIDKNFSSFIGVLCDLLSYDVIKMGFDYFHNRWYVDKSTYSRAKLDLYIQFHCYSSLDYGNVDKYEDYGSWVSRYTKKICSLTGRLTDSYYKCRDDEDVVMSSSFLEAYLHKHGRLCLSDDLIITRENIFEVCEFVVPFLADYEKVVYHKVQYEDLDYDCGAYLGNR